jgi:hypothetical protein
MLGTAQCTHTVQTPNDDGNVLEDKSRDYAIEDNIFYATAQHNAHTLCKQPTMMKKYWKTKVEITQ